MEDAPQQAQIDDKYIIKKKLSYGGQANVFLVKKTESDEKYAAKVPIQDDSFLDSECDILEYLKKKIVQDIINIVDKGKGEIIRKNRKTEEKKYMILEYASNKDLEQYIRFPKTGFGEKFSKVIFYRIAKSIKDIHDNETCHRDIKLDNILLDDNYHPKLSDFGHAAKSGTFMNDFAGTPGYMAPEIIEGKAYDGYKVDIYSLGVTLFRLTLGISVFTDDNEQNSIYNLIKKKYNDLYWKYISIKEDNNEYINNLSEEFKSLYTKMISPDPDDRPSIDDVLYDDWFGEIRNMSTEQLDDYEKEIKLEDEFKKRRDIIDTCIKSEYQNNDEGINHIYDTRGFDDDEKIKQYFKADVMPKSIEDGKYMNYFINIKGCIEPNKFLNQLCNKIYDEFYDEYDCEIEVKDKNKAKFDVEFKIPEKEFVVPELLKAEFEKLGIKLNEKKEEKKGENNKIKLIMRIKLYEISEGFLVRFVKKEGNKNDFINKFEAISKIVESIIKNKNENIEI